MMSLLLNTVLLSAENSKGLTKIIALNRILLKTARVLIYHRTL